MPDPILLLGRFALSAPYLESAIGNFGGLSNLSGMLADKGFPAPLAFAVIAAASELAGSAAVIDGFRRRRVPSVHEECRFRRWLSGPSRHGTGPVLVRRLTQSQRRERFRCG